MHCHCGYFTLIFQIFFSVCLWCICTGIASTFISASFSASMRSYMPFFKATTLSRIISNSCHVIYSCSTLFCLGPKALHTLCILIGLQHLSEKLFPPIHIPKSLLKIPCLVLLLLSTALAHPENMLGGQKHFMI